MWLAVLEYSGIQSDFKQIYTYINVNCMPDHAYRDACPSIFLYRVFHITYTLHGVSSTNHFCGVERGRGRGGGGVGEGEGDEGGV